METKRATDALDGLKLSPIRRANLATDRSYDKTDQIRIVEARIAVNSTHGAFKRAGCVDRRTERSRIRELALRLGLEKKSPLFHTDHLLSLFF